MIKTTAVSGLLMLAGLAFAQPQSATTVTQADSAEKEVRSTYTMSPIRGYVGPGSTNIQHTTDRFVNRGVSNFHSREGEETQAQEVGLLKKIKAVTSKIAAKDESVRDAGMKELQVVLDKLFDVRTSAREAKIAELETRLSKLRDQLEERKDRKSDIVDLRLQTILNEADGLSF